MGPLVQEDGPRPLCPSLGHRDPCVRGVVGTGLVTTSGGTGAGCAAADCTPSLPHPWGGATDTQILQPGGPQPSRALVSRWVDGWVEGEGQARGGVVLSPADVSTRSLGLRSWGRGVGRGAAAGGSWSPWCPSRWVLVSPHTEISYVVPPTPDTFLTSVCRAGLAEGPGGPAAGPRRARPGDCPLSLLGGVFS